LRKRLQFFLTVCVHLLLCFILGMGSADADADVELRVWNQFEKQQISISFSLGRHDEGPYACFILPNLDFPTRLRIICDAVSSQDTFIRILTSVCLVFWQSKKIQPQPAPCPHSSFQQHCCCIVAPIDGLRSSISHVFPVKQQPIGICLQSGS